MINFPCPLCESSKTKFYIHTKDRDYFCCDYCNLIFVLPQYHLDKKEEKKRYNYHQNNIVNDGYKKFLYQIIEPIKRNLPIGSKGLDFGSGPYPALAELLKNESYSMMYYDPFYFDNKEVLQKRYDFITLTEVAEHFYSPGLEFQQLIKLLKPKGYLFIMTHRTDQVTNFENWYYKNDETHVCFYSDKSIRFIANKYNMIVTIVNERTVFLQKRN